MDVILDKVRYKPVLDSDIWINNNGTSVLLSKDGEFKELPVKTHVSKKSFKYVNHNQKGLTSQVARLVMLAWTKFPEVYLEFKIDFADNDRLNTELSNMSWERYVTRPAVAVKQVLDSYLYISNDGEHSYRKFTDNCWRSIGTYKDEAGYVQVNHYCKNIPKNRHRLVLLAWKEVPNNWRILEGNHLNNTPGDDRIDNLNWLSVSGNALYSSAQGRKGSGELYLLNLNDEIEKFPTATAFTAIHSPSLKTLRKHLKIHPVIEVPAGKVSYDLSLLLK